MKRYLYILASFALAATVISCEKDKYGTEPGNDSTPNVVIKTFTAELPNDPDCDAVVRFAANNATTEVYYFAERATEKEKRGLSEDAYADYVVSNGTKVTMENNVFDGSSVADVVVKSLYYENVITAVAVGNGKKSAFSTTYTGYKWNTLCSGTYRFKNSWAAGLAGVTTKEATLQQRDDDKTQYRIKDLYATGYHLCFFSIDQKKTDDDGTYQFLRIPAQSTGLVHSKYGALSVRDVGYWQGDDAYVTEGGYESGMYEDYYCFFCDQYYVSAGNAGMQYEYFVPSN